MPNSYSDFVASVWKPGADIVLDAKQRELLHAGLLLTGEAAELLAADSIENVKEEIGDLLFGMHALRNLVPGVFWLSHIHYRYTTATVGDIVITCGDIADTIKKHAIYGQDLDHAKLATYCQLLSNHINGLCDYLGVTCEELIEANQTKLEKRYPKGYSDAAAKARADKE